MVEPTADDAGGPAARRPGTGSVRLAAARTSLRRHHDQLVDRSPVAGALSDAVRRSAGGTGSLVGGHLAYRLFLLLLPLGAILVALVGIDPDATADAADHLGLGRSITSVIADAGQDVERSRLPLLATAVLGFALASWGLLGALQYTAALAWRIPMRRFPGKGRALMRLAASVVVFIGITYLSVLVRRAGLFAGLAASVANTAAAFVAFLAISWILPRRCTSWVWLIPGAAVGAVGVLVLQLVGSLWLPGKVAAASGTYGALGVALAVLVYLFLVGLLLWAVVLVDAVVWERFRAEPPRFLRRLEAAVPRGRSGSAPGGAVDDDPARLRR